MAEIKDFKGYKKEKDLLLPNNNLSKAWGTEALDMVEIPWDDPNPDNISLNKLIPRKYAMDPVAGGKFIELGEFNGLMKALSSYVNNVFMYTGGMPYHEQWATDNGGYPIDCIVSVLYDPFSGTLWMPGSNTTPTPPEGMSEENFRAMQRRLLLRSLKSDNMISPLILQNLYKSWEVVDGRAFGEVIKLATHSPFPPPGYLDMSFALHTKFKLVDYPRVALYLQHTKDPCSHFKKLDDDQFTITNVGGLFERVFNTTTGTEEIDNPDVGRTFSEVQQDAMGVITGAVNLVDYSRYGSDSYGDVANRCVSLRAFSPVAKLPRQLENKQEYAYLKTVESNNAFKIIDMPTNYSMSSDSYRFHGIYGSNISEEGIKNATGSTLVLDTSDHPKSSHEVRPKNYCVKAYIKV